MQLRLLNAAAGIAHPRHESAARPRRIGPRFATGNAGQMHFWRPLPPTVMDLICGEGTTPEVPLQTHEALQVLLPMSRFSVLDGAGRSAVVSPGVIHLTSPLELQAAHSIDGTPLALRVMLVPPSVLAEIRGTSPARASELTLGFTERIVDDANLYGELWRLFDDLSRPLVTVDCKARLLDCLTRLLAHDDRPHAAPARAADHVSGAERVRNYLRLHVADNMTLDQLARVAGLSKFYLLRAFRRAYGLTPHAYQMQLRLARARQLIADGRSLTYVTYDAGFADQSHLTRRFAAFFSLTPARYARQLAATIRPTPPVPSAASRAVTQPPAA